MPSPTCHFLVTDGGTEIQEDNLVFETNEGDLYALEEALRLKDRFQCEIVILSLGEKRVLKTLREGLAMGADRAIHLYDPGFHGTDSCVAARAIASAIRSEGCDLIFTGVESPDHGEAQMGLILAELLGWPHATAVVALDADGTSKMQVTRELGGNMFERLEISLPAVLTIQTGINKPRYPTLRGILQSRGRTIRTCSAEQLGLADHEIGHAGALVEYLRLCVPEKGKKVVILDGTPEEAARSLMHRLHQEDRLL